VAECDTGKRGAFTHQLESWRSLNWLRLFV
jgi:hypothetical protein